MVMHGRWLALDGVSLAAMVIPIYVGVAINGNTYTHKSLTSPGQAAVQAVMAMLFTMLAVLCVLYFAHVSEAISRLAFASGMIGSAVLLAVSRHPFSRYALASTGGALTEELVICDGVEISRDVDRSTTLIDAEVHGLEPDLNDPYMLNRLGRWMRTFDRVIIACSADRQAAWTIVLQGANIQGEVMLPGSGMLGAIGIGRFQNRDTYVVSKGPLNMANRARKRAFDLAVTVPAILFLSPLLLFVALAIRLESAGPVLFKQERIGRGNRLFKIAKFRSMRIETVDHAGSASAMRDDRRVTRVGHFIRRTSIDELPQLFNVLLGDMSIVGPRPHALGSKADTKLFWEINQQYWRRHALKPGMTGLAQVRGFRGATERTSDLESRLEADLEYLKDWSLTRELFIILRTFKVIVHKNAF
jgi:exopolysaccharide biosynthesis polyprenyl glycosylphosphotransferase